MLSLDLADLIITQANTVHQPISNLHLQRILYFLHVQSLLLNHRPLVTDERFVKYDYGATLKSVYNEYAPVFSGNPIPKYLTHYSLSHDTATDHYSVQKHVFNPAQFQQDYPVTVAFVEQHLALWLAYDPFDLVAFSQQEPQWRDRRQPWYDDQKTDHYWRRKSHQFWNQPQGKRPC